MNKKAEHIWLPIGIMIGIALALFLGWLVGPSIGMFGFLGVLFLNGLKMVIVPLILTTMILGIVRLGDFRTLGYTGLKTLGYYTVTTGIAVMVGLVFVNLINPGIGSELDTSGAEQLTGVEDLSITGIVTSIVPENIVAAMANLDTLGLIFFSILFGAILSTIGDKGKPLIEVLEAIETVIFKIVELVIWLSPIGVFGLVAGQIQEAGGLDVFYDKYLSPLRYYALTVIVSLLVHGLVVLPLLLIFFGKRNPLKYMWNMLSALLTAFSTASSSATLPVTIECAEENNGVNPKSTRFVLPLGATVNMDGTAMYEAVAAIFIAQLYGIDLTFAQQAIIFFTATLAAIGAAGIPQAGTVTMIMVLKAVDLPLEGITLILAIDWFLDRCRTTINVWGDSVGAAVIANTKEMKAA